MQLTDNQIKKKLNHREFVTRVGRFEAGDTCYLTWRFNADKGYKGGMGKLVPEDMKERAELQFNQPGILKDDGSTDAILCKAEIKYVGVSKNRNTAPIISEPSETVVAIKNVELLDRNPPDS